MRKDLYNCGKCLLASLRYLEIEQQIFRESNYVEIAKEKFNHRIDNWVVAKAVIEWKGLLVRIRAS